MRDQRILIRGIIAACCIVTISPAWAQAQTQAAQRQQSKVENKRKQIIKELSEVQERYRKLQAQLSRIAQKAEEQNPNLQKLHNEVMEIYQEKLKEYGYPKEEELNKLRDIQQKLKAPGASDMKEAKRQQLMQEFNAGLADLQEAQEKAQNDAKVVNAQETLDQARLKAMSKIDPQTTTMQEKLTIMQRKLEQLRQELQQVLQPSQ